MNTAQSHNSEKLLTLKEASVDLGVSIETLLSWNEHNILKPTITVQGEIGYTKTQLNQFVTIRHSFQEAVSPKHAGKTNLPRVFSSVAVVVVCLTIAALTVPDQDKKITQPFSDRILGVQTSKFNLSEQIIAALPIHLRHQTSQKRIFAR